MTKIKISCGPIRAAFVGLLKYTADITRPVVHREAARPATITDIEDGLPGGREVGGELHVQPCAAHSPRHMAGERKARKYSTDTVR